MQGQLRGKMFCKLEAEHTLANTLQTTSTLLLPPCSKYLVRASYLQIYNEVISDMLKPERTNLIIREDRRRGVFVEGLSEWVVRSPGEVYMLMQRGQAMVSVNGVRKCGMCGVRTTRTVRTARMGMLAEQPLTCPPSLPRFLPCPPCSVQQEPPS